MRELKVFCCCFLRGPRPFMIHHALPPFLHCAVRRRLIPKGFNEVVMNFLRGHAPLTEVLYDCSNFILVYFQFNNHSLDCTEFLSFEIISFEVLFFLPKMLNKIKISTDCSFLSVYSNFKYIGPYMSWSYLVYYTNKSMLLPNDVFLAKNAG